MKLTKKNLVLELKNVCQYRWGACAPFVRRRIINISYENRSDGRHCPGYTSNNLIILLNLRSKTMMENATSSEVMDNFIFQAIKPKAKRNFHPHPVTFPVRRQVLWGKIKENSESL